MSISHSLSKAWFCLGRVWGVSFLPLFFPFALLLRKLEPALRKTERKQSHHDSTEQSVLRISAL